MPEGLHQLSVEIGSIRTQIENLTSLVKETRDDSRDEHRKVHDIIDALSGAVRTLAANVAEMKPLTEDYREKRAEARGAARLVRWLYVSGGGLFGAGAIRAMDWFNSAKPPHP